MTIYDLKRLKTELDQQAIDLIYEPVVTSTIDVTLRQNSKRAAIVADHQTAGRGRYSRVWRDEPSQDLLLTMVRLIPTQLMPPVGSLLLSHLFVLSVWQAIDSNEVLVRWPNDLFARDKKLGGVLLSKSEYDKRSQKVLFSVGLNLETKIEQLDAISLGDIEPQFDTTDLVVAINRNLDAMLADLARFNVKQVCDYYEKIWKKASMLIGRNIAVEGGVEDIEGVVVKSPLGGSLRLETKAGSIMEIKEYGHQAHIKLL